MTTPFKWSPANELEDFGVEEIGPSEIIALTNGGFLFVWQPPDGDSVRAQMFDADGGKAGDEILIHDAVDGDPPVFLAVTPLANGGFAAALQYPIISEPPEIRVYNTAGDLEDAFAVDESVGGTGDLDIAEMPDGRLLFVWGEGDINGGGDGDGTGVFGAIFSNDGVPQSGRFPINTDIEGTQNTVQVAVAPDGTFITTWQHPSSVINEPIEVKAQIFSANGTPIGGEIDVADGEVPVAAALNNGRFVLAWTDKSETSPNENGAAALAQIYQSDGNPLGDPFLVNTPVAGAQSVQGDPMVVALADGGFLIGWDEADTTSDNVADWVFGAKGQRFDADGNKVGVEFHIGSPDNLADVQSLAVLGDGRVVALLGQGQIDPDTLVIDRQLLSQILDPRDQPADFVGTFGGDQFVGTIFGDMLDGRSGNDKLWGEGGSDTIFGGDGEDVLRGGAGNDTISGGRQKDKLFGDGGGDTFVFHHLKDSKTKASKRDTIKDFDSAEGDGIDLSAIDAKTGGGDSNFKLIGNADFSGKKGELRTVEKANAIIVKGDVDGDGKADFAIRVKDAGSLTEDDFIL